MGADQRLRVGVVGAVNRGAGFARLLERTGFFACHAVCDTHEARLEDIRRETGAAEAWLNYDEMLARSDIEAVVIATPMPLHAPMAIAALERGLHVLSEVPAAISLEECRALTLAARRSAGTYMLGENYTFMRESQLVKGLAERGLFGETYHAEAEYIHELKALNEQTPWRRHWQTGINGNTYCTHSLGPVLQWMPGARVTSVCCVGAGRRHRDPRGVPYEQESTTTTLCRTSKGGLIKLRLDMLSDRPHAMTNYSLQGTDGAYESGRAHGENHRIWLRSRQPSPDRWESLHNLEPEHTPEMWRDATLLEGVGHGGGDLLELLYWRDVILGRRSNELGIDQAMDLTLPGLVSQQSIAQGGGWLPVPDSREWTETPRLPPAQLFMVWPEERPVPEVRLPAGYSLETFREADASGLVQLMHKAGFVDWTPQTLAGVQRTLLPGGLFLVRHEATGEVVATANANNRPSERYPEGGELGWVAADPAHAGRGLGRAVCAAVVRRFLQAGFRTIYLSTDDHRLPAIRVYLDLGFVPHLWLEDMPARWEAVRRRLAVRA